MWKPQARRRSGGPDHPDRRRSGRPAILRGGLAAAALLVGCLPVGDPVIGRGSIGGINGSQAVVDATHVNVEGDNRQVFVSEDLSGDVPLLRFAFNLNSGTIVPGHDEPARLADGGVHDGRPLTAVIDCIRAELGLSSREEALRQLGRDGKPAARLRPSERTGSWLTLLACDPGDDGHPES